MRGKFSQVRRVERQEMFRSSWVAKDKEQKGSGGKAKERRKEWSEIVSVFCFGFLLPFIKKTVRYCDNREKVRKA